jgi:hypothetical protein
MRGLAGPDPACSPLTVSVISGTLMSERIDARADLSIAGAAGNAVRAEWAAPARWLAGRRVLFRQAPACTALRGRGGVRGQQRGSARAAPPSSPGPAGLRRHGRGKRHARLLRAARGAPGTIAAARPCGHRRAAAAGAADEVGHAATGGVPGGVRFGHDRISYTARTTRRPALPVSLNTSGAQSPGSPLCLGTVSPAGQ